MPSSLQQEQWTPAFALIFTHIFGWTQGGRSQKLSPLPWAEGGDPAGAGEPGEGLLGYVGPYESLPAVQVTPHPARAGW